MTDATPGATLPSAYVSSWTRGVPVRTPASLASETFSFAEASRTERAIPA